MAESPTSSAPQSRRGGCLAFVAVLGAWLFLLHGFTSTRSVVLLAVLGACLACGGLYLAVSSFRLVFETPWYAGAFALGLVMLLGAAATLAPAAPGGLLATTSSGWSLLERRADRLKEAIGEGDVALAAKVARRGLGDPVPRDASGIPLLRLARGSEMVDGLLASGLDPDARDEEGRTLLMQTSDVETARRLLEAGANPNARDRNGSTVLMRRGDDPPEMIELLLDAGADVHAADDSGRTVADLVRGPGRALLDSYAGGEPLRESGSVTLRGREDWLVPGSAASTGAPSLVSLQPGPLLPGELGTVTIELDNVSGEDRLLELRAELNNAVFFVGASHGGAVEDLGRPGATSSVRWPPLALPAERRGHLELRVLARPDHALSELPAGDLSVDVRVVDLPQRSEEVLQVYQPREGPPARAELGSPSSYLSFLLPLGLVIAIWLVWRRVRGPSSAEQRYRLGRIVAAAAALVCAALAASMAWSIAEPFARFDEAPCRVLDHRVFSQTVHYSSSEGSRPRSTTTHYPLATVEIDAGDHRLVTAGFATGLANRSVQNLRAVPLGVTANCWLDPGDPERFTLVRTASLGGVVGLALLLVLSLVLGTIAARLGRGSRARSE